MRVVVIGASGQLARELQRGALSSRSCCDFGQAVVDEQGRFTRRRPRVTPTSTRECPTPAKRPPNPVLDTSCFEQR
jgi:dTDP-4-dehydrorhamnose reductase